jgi:hypothetical protein
MPKSRLNPSTKRTASAARSRPARWKRPFVTDETAFAAAHPETVVSAELWARLEPEIARRARILEYDDDPAVQADLRAELRLSIIEAARTARSRDARGGPVYDYLAQHPTYIVWHAAGPIYSRLRRERRQAETTLRYELLGGEDEWGALTPAETIDETTTVPMSSSLEGAELFTAIAARLSPAQRRVLELLAEGSERGEIGDLLGLSRKTIHDHIVAIREATLAVVGDDRLVAAFIEGRSATRRVSASPRRKVRPTPPAPALTRPLHNDARPRRAGAREAAPLRRG